jgi:hypothetical protein
MADDFTAKPGCKLCSPLHKVAGRLWQTWFMMQTVARRPETLCPESGTNCRAVCWHSSYGWKSVRTGPAFCVTATRNDAGESAITKTMNGASVTPLSLTESQNQKVSNRQNVSAPFLVREREVWGMTLTPPANASPGGNRSVRGNETAVLADGHQAERRTAHRKRKQQRP